MGNVGSHRSFFRGHSLPLLVRRQNPPRRSVTLRITQVVSPAFPVILSEDCASRSEAQPQSKDPFHHPLRSTSKGVSIHARSGVSALDLLGTPVGSGRLSLTELSPPSRRTIK